MQMEKTIERKFDYMESGQVAGAMPQVIMLVLTVGVTVIIYIFVGVISGQTFQLTEADIDAITNTTVKENIKGGIVKGFEGYKQLGTYMPLIVLALVLGLILTVLIGIVYLTGGIGTGRGGGAAL